LAAFASRRSLFFFRARVFLPDIALEGWMVCVRIVCARGCASLYLEGSRRPRKAFFCLERKIE
jgi:hypothetical protein